MEVESSEERINFQFIEPSTILLILLYLLAYSSATLISPDYKYSIKNRQDSVVALVAGGTSDVEAIRDAVRSTEVGLPSCTFFFNQSGTSLSYGRQWWVIVWIIISWGIVKYLSIWGKGLYTSHPGKIHSCRFHTRDCIGNHASKSFDRLIILFRLPLQQHDTSMKWYYIENSPCGKLRPQFRAYIHIPRRLRYRRCWHLFHDILDQRARFHRWPAEQVESVGSDSSHRVW